MSPILCSGEHVGPYRHSDSTFLAGCIAGFGDWIFNSSFVGLGWRRAIYRVGNVDVQGRDRVSLSCSVGCGRLSLRQCQIEIEKEIPIDGLPT